MYALCICAIWVSGHGFRHWGCISRISENTMQAPQAIAALDCCLTCTSPIHAQVTHLCSVPHIYLCSENFLLSVRFASLIEAALPLWYMGMQALLPLRTIAS